MDLHAEMKKQEGLTLETLSHGKGFMVAAVDDSGVVVQPAGANERKITWRTLEGAWAHLQREGKLNQIEVGEHYSKVSAGHVLALLAALPGVKAGKEKAEEDGRVSPTVYYRVKQRKERQPRKKAKPNKRDERDWAVWWDSGR